MDPAPDPALFVSDLRDANLNIFFSLSFYAKSLLEVHLHHSSNTSRKDITKQFYQGFSLFYLLMEGSGSGSGQINYGSRCGSRWPKHTDADPEQC